MAYPEFMIGLEMFGDNFWHTIPSHSHDFILIPIPGRWNSDTSIDSWKTNSHSLPFPFSFEQEQFQLLKW